MRADDPAGWADAVGFDAAIRHGSARANSGGHPLRGQFFLHRQRIPLDQVRLRPRPTGGDADLPGCGPWTCPHPPDVQASAGTLAPGGVAPGLREVA
jgi:hypothetical protein